MKSFKSILYCLAVLMLVFALLTPEVEARRKVLRGRRTVTRNYYRELPIPAWAIVTLVGIGQLIIGGILFVVMKKTIVDTQITGSYTPANTA